MDLLFANPHRHPIANQEMYHHIYIIFSKAGNVVKDNKFNSKAGKHEIP